MEESESRFLEIDGTTTFCDDGLLKLVVVVMDPVLAVTDVRVAMERRTMRFFLEENMIALLLVAIALLC
jgi:hypothetical protein